MKLLSSQIEPNQTDPNRTESSRIKQNKTVRQKPMIYSVRAKWPLFVFFLFAYAFLTLEVVNAQMNTPSTIESGATLEYMLIGNEGGFGSSNATISRYNPVTKNLQDGVFLSANGIGLGDVLQSVHYNEGQVFAVMNNSAQIVIMDSESFTQQGLISLPDGASPRQLLLLSPELALSLIHI